MSTQQEILSKKLPLGGMGGRAALFDLDGVVFDTEPQYTVFWGGVISQESLRISCHTFQRNMRILSRDLMSSNATWITHSLRALRIS